MKFSVSSSALLSLLATTGKVISNKNTLPILDYFLMELNGNDAARSPRPTSKRRSSGRSRWTASRARVRSPRRPN